MNISDLSVAQLRQAASIKEQLENLHKQLTSILGTATPARPAARSKKKWKLSAVGLANIRAVQKARWAKIKAAKKTKVVPAPKKWKISAAGMARIRAASKAYWAKKKAAQK
jgi:hypothetical protein